MSGATPESGLSTTIRGLDCDDSDGAGPENLNLDKPEDGLTYTVGVHHWDDQGFGASYATARIYIASVLVFQVEGVELTPNDMWAVANTDGPSGEISPLTATDGGHQILADFAYPDFGTPKD